MATDLVTYSQGTAKLGQIPDGLRGNMQIVVRMIELVRNSVKFDKGLETFVKTIILQQNNLDSYSSNSQIFNAVFDYVHNNITYIKDAAGSNENLKDARNTLEDGFGDCDDQSVLVASILAILGFEPVFCLARYSINQESFSHIYTVTYVNGARFVFDTTLPDGQLNKEITPITTKEIPVYGYVPELDGFTGFVNQAKYKLKSLSVAGLEATPTLLSFLPFGIGYVATHLFSAGSQMVSNSLGQPQTYSELASSVNRQLTSIIKALYKGTITLDEANQYAQKYANNLQRVKLRAETENEKLLETKILDNLEIIANFSSVANASGVTTFNLDSNKALLIGAVAIGGGLYFLMKK